MARWRKRTQADLSVRVGTYVVAETPNAIAMRMDKNPLRGDTYAATVFLRKDLALAEAARELRLLILELEDQAHGLTAHAPALLERQHPAP